MKKSFFYQYRNKERSGIALILAVGALAVITVITLGFSFNMQAQYKTSLNYLNALKARYIAESGIERAVADLKNDAKACFIYKKDNLSNVSGDWNASAAITNMALGSGTYTVTVEDEQSKININTASQALLENIGFTTAQASDITTNRPFNVIGELRKISSIDEAAYNNLAGYLTVNSYCDPNCFSRSPVNVNTAADDVLKAVFKNLSNGTTTITDADAAELTTSVKTTRPIGMWLAFNDAVDAALSDVAKREIVKNNCNPNNDKSALTSETTEFCFFSGGHYTINSTGTMGKYTNRVKTIVKVYDMVNESTSADFLGGILKNVSASNAACAGPIPNSLKVGYYDDFSSNDEWILTGTANIAAKALTTNSNETATLNRNPGKYLLTTGTELISVDVSPRNDGTSGFQALPHPFYATSGPPIETIEAKIVGNSLQLTSVNCTAIWQNLQLLTKTGDYTTRAYAIPVDAEKPAYIPYGAKNYIDPTSYSSSISLSFTGSGAHTIQVKANFDNPMLSSKAMVLEDIWFTYLPKTQFLYRQEG